MRDNWNFLHHSCFTSGGRMKFVMMQLIEISTLWKIINLKNWSIGILQFTFGQLVYWSERAKEANLKESDWNNHMVSIQSSNGYLSDEVYFTVCKWLAISVLCFETMFVWSWTDKSSLWYTLLFTNVLLNWCIMVLLLETQSMQQCTLWEDLAFLYSC